jgi:nucleotide-binding universal stress UspA family protein
MGAEGAVGPNVSLGIREVVVPLDGSAFARRAAGPAAAVASALGAGVTYVHVMRSLPAAGAEEALRAEMAPPEPSAGWRVLVGDDAGLAVGEFADESAGALVCMSSHGRGWPSSVLIGSAAAVVLAATEQPLLLVGPACREGWVLGGRLAACVDGEAGGEAMLSTATMWSTALGAPLSVVTVAEPAPPALRPGHTHRHHGPPGDPQAYVDDLAGTLDGTPEPVIGEVIWDPVGVADGLIGWLASDPGGLLVVSSHGRRPRADTPLGRTALHVVHRSPVPVLIVPFVGPQPPDQS